jgi:hypothetical protein
MAAAEQFCWIGLAKDLGVNVKVTGSRSTVPLGGLRLSVETVVERDL